MSDNFEFQFDKSESFESNFTKWRQLNVEERSAWNEPQLDLEEAEVLFNKLFGQYRLQGTK
jgi:hypothetical protein